MWGTVLPTNRRAPTVSRHETLVVQRERAGRGFRHVLTRDDVTRFVALLDDWDDLARGLRTIRLASGSLIHGYWRPGVVAVCAFPDDRRMPECYLDAYALRLFERLDVRAAPGACPECQRRVPIHALEPAQVRAWQLLDVLQHELGHHHDAMTNRRGVIQRGERYALEFAEERWQSLWPKYQRAFDI